MSDGRSGWLEGTGEDGGDDDGAADQCPGSGSLAEEDEHPDGIKDGFDDGDHDGLESGNRLDGQGIQDPGKAQLKYPQEGQIRPLSNVGQRSEHEGKAGEGGEDIAQKYGAQSQFASLFSHEENEKGDTQGREERQQVAEVSRGREFVEKEQGYADDRGGNQQPVKRADPFLEKQGTEQGNVNGCGVLQQYRIGGGGQFVSRYEQDDRCGITDGAGNLVFRPVQMGAPQNEQQHERSYGTSDPGDRQRMPGDLFYEYAAETPENGGGQEQGNRFDSLDLIHGDLPGNPQRRDSRDRSYQDVPARLNFEDLIEFGRFGQSICLSRRGQEQAGEGEDRDRESVSCESKAR